jgi:hypothetical protein
MVPTLWIVLGPLGQSVTAAGLLANAAPSALPDLYAEGLTVFSVIFGVATWGFAMLWLALVLAVTVKTARAGNLKFNLTWWSFTFPLGTCITGSTVLYGHTGAYLFAISAVALYTLLVTAWAVVAARTARGVFTGTLLRPAAGLARHGRTRYDLRIEQREAPGSQQPGDRLRFRLWQGVIGVHPQHCGRVVQADHLFFGLGRGAAAGGDRVGRECGLAWIQAASVEPSSKTSPSTKAMRSSRTRHCSMAWLQLRRTSADSSSASGPR